MNTATAVLTEAMPLLTRYREDVPELLQHTIKKMSAKGLDQRYQLIRDVRTDLGELISPSGEPEIRAEAPTTRPVQRSYLWPVVAGGVMVLIILVLVLF